MSQSLILLHEQATESIGEQLAKAISPPAVLFLEGELGAGKTTLVRGFLRALGHSGAVKSPTYTLVEEYDFSQGPVYHFDLYRLQNPQELEFVGIREYLSKEAIILIEWAEKGERFLPKPDLLLILQVIEKGRALQIKSFTALGKQWVEKIHESLSLP